MSAIGRYWNRDKLLVVLLALVLLASITAYIVVYRSGHLLAYADSLSHLMISRRVLDSPTPGFSQLGGVWPPAPHVLSLPFVWNNWMYTSGSAGSVLSMLSYVGSAVFVYKICTAIGVRPWVALAGTLIFAFNPNVLHMQATSMTELPLLLSITAAVYCLVRWCQSESMYWLVCTIAAVVFGTATRYEAWAMLGFICAVILWVCLTRRYSVPRSIDVLLYFGFFASTFVFGWIAWNKIIIQSGWLGFLDSEYASASIWVEASEPAIGSPQVALNTYLYAIRHISGLGPMILAGAGVLLFMLRNRLKVHTVGAYVLLFAVPFFMITLALGQRPLHVPEINGDAYNVRFALQVMPAIGVFGAYFANTIVDVVVAIQPISLQWPIRMMSRRFVSVIAPMSFGVLIAVTGVLVAPSYIITLDEPNAAAKYQQDQYDVSDWFRSAYPGHGRVLMETPGNEIALFRSNIALENVIYEGANKNQIWEQALQSPDDYVDWVFMRTTPGAHDKVAEAMYSRPGSLNGYTLAFQSDSYRIYGRSELVKQLGDQSDGGNLNDPNGLSIKRREQQ